MRGAASRGVGPAWRTAALGCALSAAGAGGCRPAAGPGDPVDVLYAGSLAAIMGDLLAPAFEEASGRAVRGEPHGSLAAAHQIRDRVRDPDLYITADPRTLELLGERNPGWAVAFATGELVVAYAPESRFAPPLDSAAAGLLSWARVLARPGFRLGRTEPTLDPKGYRALWLLEVAGEAVGDADLPRRLTAVPGTAFPEPHLPARVEGGALDAGVFYLAEARAHGLRVLRLPPEASQADPGRAAEYARHRYVTDGVEIRGSPILYAAVVPRDAPDIGAGADFLEFLLGPAGRAALERAGLPPVARLLGDPARAPPRFRGLPPAPPRPEAAGVAAPPAPGYWGGMRARSLLAVSILVGWAVVLGWHVRREYFRPAEERLAEAARVLPPGVAYYSVFRGQARVGWGQSELDTLPAGTGFTLRERYEIRVPGLGEAGRSEVRSEARLDGRLRVRSFRHTAGPQGSGTRVEGRVEGDSLLRLTVQGRDRGETRQIPIEGGLLLPAAWPLRLAATGGAEPGDRYTLRVIDPASADVRRLELEVRERARRTYPDSADVDSLSGRWYVAHLDTVTAWEVVQRVEGLPRTVWIDEDGRVLEGEAPGGLRLERTAFELAFYSRPWASPADGAGEEGRVGRREAVP